MLMDKRKVQRMILNHIEDLEKEIDNRDINRENKIDLLQAKSTTLLALAELVSD